MRSSKINSTDTGPLGPSIFHAETRERIFQPPASLLQHEVGPTLERRENARDRRLLRELYEAKMETILAFPKLSKDAIQARQWVRIVDLVKYAYTHIPLYQELYGEVGFEPGDLKGWEDFHRLPTLSKERLIAAWPDKSVSPEHNFEFMTFSSGSSGRFVYVAVSEEGVHLDTLLGVRQIHMQSGRHLPEDSLVVHITTCPWWFDSVDGLYPMIFLNTRDSPESLVAAIRTHRPKVLTVYAGYLNKLIEVDPNFARNRLEWVIVHSEPSATNERATWSRTLGVPVREEYSSEELTRISLECPHGFHHLEEDACYTELLPPPSDHFSLPEGLGEVVGTNLLNKATPLIRYRQGDFTRFLSDETCACGSNFRRVAAPLGRIDDSIITPEGRSIPSGVVLDEAYNWVLEARIPGNGLRYQVVQSATDLVEVFVAPQLTLSDTKRGEVETVIKSRMRELFGHELQVGCRVVERLPHAGKGPKTKAVISLIDRKEG